jgi:hypothetical protein
MAQAPATIHRLTLDVIAPLLTNPIFDTVVQL